jgi:hypothetical protein
MAVSEELAKALAKDFIPVFVFFFVLNQFGNST